MISYNTISNSDVWAGVDWAIVDEEKAAELVARVALGQARHVSKILRSVNSTTHPAAETVRKGAINLLTANSVDDPYHRDGWLFQALAWIAAHIHRSDTVKSLPHIRPADKGFDSLELKMNKAEGTVTSVIICEQKASENPRNKIHSQVWPEVEELESGQRDNELVSDVSAILAASGTADPDEAVSKILWEHSRSYCVSVTIDDRYNNNAGRARLFSGYEKKVLNGGVDRRTVETFYKPEMRSWMDQFSQKAIKIINEMELSDV